MFVRFFITALLGCALTSRARAQFWESLQVGMSETQVIEVLGNPLLASKGRGYSSWIYDNGGRAMLHGGALLYWNTPRGYDPRKQVWAPARSVPSARVAPVAVATKPAVPVSQRAKSSDTRPAAPRGYVYR